jgi:hypothetical protein
VKDFEQLGGVCEKRISSWAVNEVFPKLNEKMRKMTKGILVISHISIRI